jgi:hypothetical protein
MGAPSSFSKLMDRVLEGLPNTISYIDDILIYSRDHESHLTHLEACFERLRRHNIKINGSKSFFATRETSYLGFQISPEGIHPGTDKLKCVRDTKAPTSIREIRQFVA